MYEQLENCAQPCAPINAMRLCAHSNDVARLRPARRLLTAGWTLALASLTLAIFTPGVQAAKPETAANTSRSTREEAIRAIPQDKLSEAGQQKVSSVLKQISIFRRLPTQVIECDPNLYLFLIEHPEMVVNMWEVMDVSDMKLEKVGPDQYKMNDGAGTIGKVEMLWHTHDLHVMFAEGAYSGPMFTSPVKGRCLLVLKTGYVRETNGKYYITCRLDTFIQLENVGIEFVARTFQPMIGKTADHNFRETAAFLAMISRSAEVQHPSLRKLTDQLTVPTDVDRAEFVSITNRIGESARELESHQGEAEQTAAITPAGSKPTATKQPSKPLAMVPGRATTPPPSSSSSSSAPATSNWPKAPIPGGTRKTVMKPSTAR